MVRLSSDPAEHVAIWALASSLERALVESFQADYNDLVTQARRHLAAGQ